MGVGAETGYVPAVSDPTPDRIRLVVQQPSLAKYRLAVFQELARRPGIDLLLAYDKSPDLPNVEPEGFAAAYEPMWRPRVLGHPVYWHPTQWRYATRRRADVLMLNWDVHYALLVPALLRARRNGVGTVLWGHGYSKSESPRRRALRLRVGRLADALLLYNHGTADAIVASGFDRGRVFVGLNSLDQDAIQSARADWLVDPDRLSAFRREHDLEGRPTILFVSRLDPANRVDLLLGAADLLRRDRPGLRVVVVGKGEDGPRLRAMVDRLGLKGVVSMPGPIYGEGAIAPYFLSATAYCYPANIGLSILHAFGYGVPVVTSGDRASQNPEIEALRDGENGLTYAPGPNDGASVDALAAALARLLDDRPLRDRLAAQAHRTATERFTIGNMVDGFEAATRAAAAVAAGRRAIG